MGTVSSFLFGMICPHREGTVGFKPYELTYFLSNPFNAIICLRWRQGYGLTPRFPLFKHPCVFFAMASAALVAYLGIIAEYMSDLLGSWMRRCVGKHMRTFVKQSSVLLLLSSIAVPFSTLLCVAASLPSLHADDSYFALAISPNNRYMAVCGTTARIYEIGSNRVVLNCPGTSGYPYCAAFTDDNHLAIGSSGEDGDDGSVLIMDLRGHACRSITKPTTYGVTSLVILDPHRLVMTQSDEAATGGSLVIYDPKSLRRVRRVLPYPCYATAYSRCKNRMAVVDKHGIEVFECHHFRRLYTIAPDQADIATAFTHDGKSLVVIGKHAQIYDARTGQKIYSSPESTNCGAAYIGTTATDTFVFMSDIMTDGPLTQRIGIFDLPHRFIAFDASAGAEHHESETSGLTVLPGTDILLQLTVEGHVYRHHVSDFMH